ncbi:MAG: hypothetical protein SGJ24_07515 [Chloroflexota bacterium]|nr:hypothetical protein [Chloroflexota bacterium]
MLFFAVMITIRAMHIDDLPVLYPLWQEQVNLLAQAESRPTVAQPSAWTTAMTSCLENPRAVCLTAVDPSDDSVPGYLLGWEGMIGLLPGQDSRLGVISELVIEMHRYRGGLARALVEAAREAFAQRGIARLVALSPRHAVISQAFWRSLGGTTGFDGFLLP